MRPGQELERTLARKVAAGVVAALGVIAVLALVPETSSGGGLQQLCGTVRGHDERFVHARVGLVLHQGATPLPAVGPEGWSLPPVEVNADMPEADGVEPGTPADTGAYEDSFCFTGVPAAADAYRLEVLPLDGGGAVSTARYGGTSPRRVTLPAAGLPDPGAGPALRLPVRCEAGGTTGSIRVEAFSSGSPTSIGQVRVVSEGASAASGIAGFAVAGQPVGGPNGPISPVVVSGLEAGQRYAVEVVFANRGRMARFTEIAVRPCETTPVRAWSGAAPAGTTTRWTSRATPVNGTYLPIPGDFTGDGLDDVFFYAPGSTLDYLWVSTGTGFASRAFPVNGVYRPTAGDFDGDGVDDLFFFAAGPAADHMWYFDPGGTTYTSVPSPADTASTTRPAAGDLDGNGVDDVLFYTPNGSDVVWRHESGGARSAAPIAISTASNLGVGDVDGDGRDDVLQQSTRTGGIRWFFGTASGGFDQTTGSTSPRNRPIVADLSCDLRADVVMYQPGSGADSLWRSRAGGRPSFAQEALAVSGEYLYPFTGDFDGNGCDDVFWYQPGPRADTIWMNSPIGWHPPTSTLNQGPY
jgi:hypothetical protein